MYPDLDVCYTLLFLIYFNISFTYNNYVLFQVQPPTCLMSPVKEYYLDIIKKTIFLCSADPKFIV